MSDKRLTTQDGINMDAIELMNQISEGASAAGMSFSEYIKANYDSQGLDDIQGVVKEGLSDNQGKIDEFRQNNNIKRESIDLSGMDDASLDLMQADVNTKLDSVRADYSAMHVGHPISREAVLV